MRVCREQRTYARHTVEMRLDRDRFTTALLEVVAMTANCFVVYHTSTCALHPPAVLGRISILLRAGNVDAFAAVMTSGKNPRALSPHGYIHTCILLG